MEVLFPSVLLQKFCCNLKVLIHLRVGGATGIQLKPIKRSSLVTNN